MANNNFKRPPMKKGVLKRLVKDLFREYPLQLAIVAVCIVAVSFASTIAGLFMEYYIELIGEGLESGLGAIMGRLVKAILIMLAIYATGWICSFIYTRIMAILSQSFLNKMRK